MEGLFINLEIFSYILATSNWTESIKHSHSFRHYFWGSTGRD